MVPAQAVGHGAFLMPGREDLSSTADKATLLAGELDRRVKEAKDREPQGLLRFGHDLFEFREPTLSGATDGGVSEEYVLGVGDQLQVNIFGTVAPGVPVQVDGRGDVVLPGVGKVNVAGMSLGQARRQVQTLVQRQFSSAKVDISVTRLREVRVFIQGEVYVPGAFLVPSLSSVLNVLSLSGGPTMLGSFRDIRVMRGGKVVHRVDLYALRSEGTGNPNVYLQNGDTLFVPLAANLVVLEGDFVRVNPFAWNQRLGSVEDLPTPPRPQGEGKGMASAKASPETNASGEGVASGERVPTSGASGAPAPDPSARGARPRDPRPGATDQARARAEAAPPRMLFEMLPGEHAGDAIRFAGGLLPWAEHGRLTLRRVDGLGVSSVQNLDPGALAATSLQKGDILSAYPMRDAGERQVTLKGHVRVPGCFARKAGMKVSDLLSTPQQVLSDTYLARGEVIRTREDGERTYLTFHVGKALAHDATHDLELQDRDEVRLYPLDHFRQDEHVTLQGAMKQTGTFAWFKGMRASDLVFRAGAPMKSANRMVAELSRSRRGLASEVMRLDLERLLSDEGRSPMGDGDGATNPLLEPDDVITVFERPDFRIHRQVKVLGQVERPGAYVLDQERVTLSMVIARAGGLTAQAMPAAGMLFRRPPGSVAEGDGATKKTSTRVELVDAQTAQEAKTLDPAARGIADILSRLNEAKFYPVDPTNPARGAAFFKAPILNGLGDVKQNRLVVDFAGALKGGESDPELMDGDEVVVPRRTDAAMVIGEASSPFAYFKVRKGMKVGDLVYLAGGLTRNADSSNIRLLKADGRIFDSWVHYRSVEPGDAVIIPQRIRRDSSWQDNLQALTPIALILNAIR